MYKTIKLNAESISHVLQSSKPTSLTGLWKALGGSGSVSGSASKRMREAVPNILDRLAENKAAGTSKTEVPEIHLKTKPSKKAGKKPAKASSKTVVPRHPSNPFRPGGYATLVDLIANAGAKGIGKEDLLKAYCKATGMDLQHAKYNLSVINSGEAGRNRHRSMKDNVTIIRDVDNYRIRFD